MPTLLKTCGDALPVETEIDEVRFAQFVALNAKVGDLPVAMVLGRPEPFLSRFIGSRSNRLLWTSRSIANLTEIDLLGGISPVEDWNPKGFRPTSLAYAAVEVEDIADLLNTRNLKFQGKEQPLDLQPTAIARLLRGQPTLIPGPRRVVLLPKSDSETELKPERVNSIDDGTMARLLATRKVRLDNRQIPVPLDNQTIKALLRGDEVEVGGAQVKRSASRMEISADRSLDFYKVRPDEEYGLAMYLPYRQSWELLGYGRGPLADTLLLGPGETTTFEIRAWDRRRNDIETNVSAEIEQSSGSTTGGKDAYDIAEESARASQFKLSVEGKATYQFPGGSVTAGAGVNLASELSKKAQEARNQIKESTTQASNRLKATRTMRIATGSELGTESVRTRQIKNENAGHTLHLDLYELITTYDVTTELLKGSARLVVLVRNPLNLIQTISRDELRTYESALRRALLDPALVDGFDAARLIYAFEEAKRFLCRSFSCTPPPSANLTEPQESAEVAKLREALVAALKQVITAAGSLTRTAEIASLHAYITSADDPTDVTLDDAVAHFRRWLFQRYIREQDPGFVAALTDFWSNWIPDSEGTEQVQQRFVDFISSFEFDTIAQASLATDDRKQRVLEYLYDELDKFGSTWSAAWDIEREYGFSTSDDAGVIAACKQVAAVAEAINTQKSREANAPSNIATALNEMTRTNDELVRATYPLRDVMSAYERCDALLSHMTHHLDHYLFAIWSAQRMTGARPDLKFPGLPPGLIDPRPIGLVEGRLACVVNVDFTPELRKWFDDTITENPGLDELTDTDVDANKTTIKVKGRGGILETRLGRCEGLEQWLQDTRNIERDRRKAEVEKIQAETDLTKARAADPSSLSEQPLLRVRLERADQAGNTPTP